MTGEPTIVLKPVVGTLSNFFFSLDRPPSPFLLAFSFFFSLVTAFVSFPFRYKAPRLASSDAAVTIDTSLRSLVSML